ncbi:MAG: hypothetical protein AB1500_06675, partial [Bacillota bacterium]
MPGKKRRSLPLVFAIAVMLAVLGGRFLAVAVGTDVYEGGQDSQPVEEFAPSAEDIEPPAPPTGLTVSDPGTGDYLMLQWNPNSEPDLLGYRIYRAISDGVNAPSDSDYQRLGGSMVDTQSAEYIDNTVSRDVYYSYRVTAVDQSGNESGTLPAGSTFAVDITPPATPQGLKIKELDTGHDAVISWQQNTEPDLAGYRLYRSLEASGPFELLKTLDRNESVWKEEGLTQGQWYYYYLEAFDENGNNSVPTPVQSVRPRQAVSVGFEQDDAQIPAYLSIEIDCSALFLNIPGDVITVGARALDSDGNEIPLSGVFRFATTFERFMNPFVTGTGTAEATFTADQLGGGEIAVEYFPTGTEDPALVAATNVRALYWRISFSVSGDKTTTGSSDIRLDAAVTDQEDNPVSDYAAKVIFETTASPDPLKDKGVNEKKGNKHVKRRAGRWHGPAHASIVSNGRQSGISSGSPGVDGTIEARWVASTVPGTTRVQAVLYYDDLRGESTPKRVDASGVFTIEVIPGPARYVGFSPDSVSFDGERPEKVTVQVFDAFGNATEDYSRDLRIWVQAPPDSPADFSVDGGGIWCGSGLWIPVEIEQELLVRSTSEELINKQYILVTRVEGAHLDPPPGVAQVNLPLTAEVN